MDQNPQAISQPTLTGQSAARYRYMVHINSYRDREDCTDARTDAARRSDKYLRYNANSSRYLTCESIAAAHAPCASGIPDGYRKNPRSRNPRTSTPLSALVPQATRLSHPPDPVVSVVGNILWNIHVKLHYRSCLTCSLRSISRVTSKANTFF